MPPTKNTSDFQFPALPREIFHNFTRDFAHASDRFKTPDISSAEKIQELTCSFYNFF